jgi:hypothetical protein
MKKRIQPMTERKAVPNTTRTFCDFNACVPGKA